MQSAMEKMEITLKGLLTYQSDFEKGRPGIEAEEVGMMEAPKSVQNLVANAISARVISIEKDGSVSDTPATSMPSPASDPRHDTSFTTTRTCLGTDHAVTAASRRAGAGHVASERTRGRHRRPQPCGRASAPAAVAGTRGPSPPPRRRACAGRRRYTGSTEPCPVQAPLSPSRRRAQAGRRHRRHIDSLKWCLVIEAKGVEMAEALTNIRNQANNVARKALGVPLSISVVARSSMSIPLVTTSSGATTGPIIQQIADPYQQPATDLNATRIPILVEDVVTEFINGLVDIYPDLQYLEEFPQIKVVHRVEVEHSSYDKVAVISGGQSGHEPAHAGFVGPGMLTAAVSREVFTSLPVDSILAIVRAVTGSKGCYTDAKMSLDEGFKQAKSEGYNMEMVVAGAGCVFSPPRGIAGRRGSARTIIVHKVAEEAKPAFEVDVTMGVALSVCTLPEQVTSGSLGQRQLELGLRIHGELGVAVVELQSVDIVAEHVLKQIVSRETQYLPNTRGCNDVLLVNGLGATPIMELMIAAVPELQLVYDIAIDRVYTGTLLTSLDMAGLSITVMKSDQSILRRLDVLTKALAWPVGYEGTRPPAKLHVPLAPSPSMKDDEILAPSQELSKQFLMFHMHQQSFPCVPTWGQVGSLGGGNVSSSRCYTKVKDGSSGCSTEAKPCKTRRSRLLKLLKEGS
ncbi:putative 3,4-dihydroxy-2-butanone kinase [Zea mays]|uniref:putative 3,4-dihydroxy-2-butanone kinase n=1 Tax=Zea mays TaxID=4577 RepID=UPI0016529D64|nr:putative 3,4-dihydroxy-2-butanone kinase [Zea mays]